MADVSTTAVRVAWMAASGAAENLMNGLNAKTTGKPIPQERLNALAADAKTKHAVWAKMVGIG